MELSNRQLTGLKIAVQRYHDGEKYTTISGYAGSGKSTLVRFIVEALGIDENNICYATYTGKAARVLLKKGNKNVFTLHKLLYKSYLMANGKYGKKPVEEISYDIVIVDEVSMVPKSMMQQLASYSVHIICLGDPAQLPPLFKDEDNHILDNPHIFLDEIFRQAQESEIIRLTMDIREGRPLKPCQGKEVMILNHDSLADDSMLQWADQIICAKNATRIDINNRMRQLRGFDNQDPQNGDKMICIDNYWGILSDKNKEPLINGTIGYLKNPFNTFYKYPAWIYEKQCVSILNGTIDIEDDDCFSSLDMDKNLIITGESTIDRKTLYKITKSKKYRDLIPIEVTYGYAITCWKAQGSEFNKVLALEENHPWNREEHKKYLYTAATRAIDRLVLVLK